MKTRMLLSLAAAAFAVTTTNVTALAGPSSQPDAFRGVVAAPTARADQVIVVTEATRNVNVTSGSTVRFIVGDHAFNWYFDDGASFVEAFDLALIAPSDLLHHAVTVYVAGNAMYR